MMGNKKSALVFFLGLFTATQIKLIGYIGISEIFCYLFAPFVFVRYRLEFKRWDMTPFLGVTGIWFIFAIISNIYNHNGVVPSLKGVATVYSVFAASICSFVLLSDKFSRIKWFIIGRAASQILSVFIFQTGSSIGADEFTGQDAIDAVVGYKLFWVNLASTLVLLPVKIFFLKIPFQFSIAAVAGMAVYALLTGGRSLFLSYCVSVFLVFNGRNIKKNNSKMRFKKNNVVIVVCCFVAMAALGKTVYTYSAKAGYLGEIEEKKLKEQSKQGTSALNLLMSGRGHTFIGLFAALDKPILGHGSWAIDRNNYTLNFLNEHGNKLDYQRAQQAALKRDHIIPAHSHIINAWMTNGLGGLVFWIYVLWLVYVTLKENMYVIPEFFGWFAITIPSFVWAIFFSPFGTRVESSIFIVCMLFAKSVRKKQLVIG